MPRRIGRLVRDALAHVLRNKVIMLVVLVGAIFEIASSRISPALESFTVGSAAEIVALPGKLFGTASITLVAGLAAVVFLGALASVFGMSCTLGTYVGVRSPLTAGLKSAASIKTLQFLAVESVAGGVYFLVMYSAAWLISALGFGSGPLGAALVAATMSVAFPIFYLVASCGLFITCIHGPISTKLYGASLFIRPENAKRLVMFYLFRVGVEVGLAYLVLATSNLIGLPKIWALFLATLLVTVPLSIISTASVALKLEILRETPWFGRKFASHYRQLTTA